MSEDEARRTRGTAEKRVAVDRAALAKMAPAAAEALAALRPGNKPPPRRTATGKDACEISVRLRVVTPILGGGPKLRDVDTVDIIRVPTVRGHLRFWWRALYGHQYASSQELYATESALWGRPADDNGGRSELEVAIGALVALRRVLPDGAWSRMWPVPADALWLEGEPSVLRLKPKAPMTPTLGRAAPKEGRHGYAKAREALCVAQNVDTKAKPLGPPRWWDDATLLDWLSGRCIKADPGRAPWEQYPRMASRLQVHVGIRPDTLTGDDGILFAHDVIETLERSTPGPGAGKREVAEWAIGAEVTWPVPALPDATHRMARPGSDSRIAWIEPVQDEHLFNIPPLLQKAFASPSQGLRLMAATPACFKGGWLPDGFEPVKAGDTCGSFAAACRASPASSSCAPPLCRGRCTSRAGTWRPARPRAALREAPRGLCRRGRSTSSSAPATNRSRSQRTTLRPYGAPPSAAALTRASAASCPASGTPRTPSDGKQGPSPPRAVAAACRHRPCRRRDRSPDRPHEGHRIPIVPGSSVKGVLRDARRPRTAGANDAEEKWLATFGPDGKKVDAAEHAGALVVGDARLLALPVRSFKGTFVWATSPLLLRLALRDLERLPIDPDYQRAYARWKQSLAEAGGRLKEIELASRLLVGHGNASATEVGLRVHHTWGVPIIPGSALKGLCAHYTAATYGRRHEESGGSEPPPPFAGPKSPDRIAAPPGDFYRALFGAPEVDNDASAGLVVFHDALYVPGSAPGDRPFAVDVLTVHQRSYYGQAEGQTQPGERWPNDYDSPNPVGFISVRPGTRFLLALSGEGGWPALAHDLLTEAIGAWGVGGKTSSDYGHIRA